MPLRQRLTAIDLLRGFVIVLMALDHTRDFIGPDVGLCTDMDRTTPRLFFTRWITHFCAPVFVFLAGTGAYLGRSKGTRKLAVFLLTRGLWLMFLELTMIHLFWFIKFDCDGTAIFAVCDWKILPLQVIWAIGASMVLLAGFVWLRPWIVGLVGIVIISGHNALDPITAEWVTTKTGNPLPGYLWAILHDFTAIPLGPIKVIPAYGVLAWFGVLAAGYGSGVFWDMTPQRRRAWFLSLGLGLCLAFGIIRGLNGYGDPIPRMTVTEPVLSFLNCSKYPPSLDYLLMTLGPALIALTLFDREPGRIGRWLVVFGRVPLFFYLIHLPVLQAVGVLFGVLATASPFVAAQRDKDLLYGLPITYAVWLGIAILLYFPCRWYAIVKVRSRSIWLSYV